MQQVKHNQNAFLLLFLVVILWGINSVAIKYLTHFFPPLALAPVRLTLASAFLLPIVLYQHGFQKIPRAAWGPIIGIAVFCIFLHQIVLTFGLQITSGIHAVLILGLNPLFTTVLAGFFLDEEFTAAKGLAIALGLSGLVLVVAGQSQSGASLAGDGLTLVATITFVIGSLFVKRATRYVSPLQVTAYSHTLAALGLCMLGISVNSTWVYPGLLTWQPVAVLIFSSFFSTAVGALLWNMSIKKVGASTASLFQNAAPLVGIFASALFLGEELHWQHFCALFLVLTGVSLGAGIIRIPHLLSSKAS